MRRQDQDHPVTKYDLPCSPTYTCLDRFSICPDDVEEDQNGWVPFWPLLQTLLSHSISDAVQLAELLETIAVTLRDTSGFAGDYGTLKAALGARPEFFTDMWPALVSLALDLPFLFSEHTLPILHGDGDETDVLSLSRRQAACLVMHQFLCTLAAPAWKDDNIYDFGIWYSSEQRHETAALAYLDALLLYFEQGVRDASIWNTAADDWPISYKLCSSRPEHTVEDEDGLAQPLTSMTFTLVEHYDTTPPALGLPGGATVISANRYIGFGQSATQEEIHVGISPEACPAVLITPPLKDRQALVVKGAQAMVNLVGQRRDIVSHCMPEPEGGSGSWKDRTMLFIDAIETDMILDEHGLPDLLPGNVDREINKAALAFRSGHYNKIRTGIWGCGAFGGDPGVKMLAMWCAASMAKTRLEVFVDKWQWQSAKDIGAFVQKADGRLKTQNDLRALLLSAPTTLKRLETMTWFLEQLDTRR